MSPNRRERLLEKALGWTGIRFRPGTYVKAFGWSRSLIAAAEVSVAGVLDALRVLADQSHLSLLVGSAADESPQPIQSISAGAFQKALQQPNRFDPSLGGAHVRSASSEINLLFDWAADREAPLTTVLITAQESWLDDARNVQSFTACLENLGKAAEMEYILASHVSDEERKLARGQRYETRPGAGIPYVPWLIMLGPAFVDAIGPSRLAGLAPGLVTWSNSYASIRTTNSPLAYGTAAATAAETAIRSALGAAVFVMGGEPASIRPRYAGRYVRGPETTNVAWEAYPVDR
jgi:hypothetical protein